MVWSELKKQRAEANSEPSTSHKNKLLNRQRAESFSKVTQGQGHGGKKSIMCLWKEQVEIVW